MLASIGMAVGSGLYWTAVFATVMMVVALSFLGWLEKRYGVKRELRRYQIRGPQLDVLTSAVMQTVNGLGLTLHRLSSRQRDQQFEVSFDLDASTEQNTDLVRQLTEKQLTCDVTLTGLEEGE